MVHTPTIGFICTWPVYQGTTIDRYAHSLIQGISALEHLRGGQSIATRVVVPPRPEPEGLAWLLDRICDEAGVRPVARNAPEGVELLHRTNGKTSWLFALNHSTKKVELPLEHSSHDLLTGAVVNDSVALEPTGVAIIELGPQTDAVLKTASV
jgi:beta-galactosidase GanA